MTPTGERSREAGALPATLNATQISRLSVRPRVRTKSTAAAKQADPPINSVRCTPKLSASAPAARLPNGLIPNAMAYRLITRPRLSSSTIDCKMELQEVRSATTTKPTPNKSRPARPAAEEPAPAPAPAPVKPATAVRKKTGKISRDDRKLLDLLARKEDAAVVAPEGDAMDTSTGGLDADAVARTVGANRKAFDACVSRALRLNPS